MNSMTQSDAMSTPDVTQLATTATLTGGDGHAPNEEDGSATEDEPTTPRPIGTAGDWGYGLAQARAMAQRQQPAADASKQQETNTAERQPSLGQQQTPRSRSKQE